MLVVYAFGATELNQLLRFPLLVKHYRMHKAEDPAITVAAFVKMHYIDKQPFDADYEQDMQLPFKQADEHVLILPSVLPPLIAVDIRKEYLTPKEYHSFNEFYPPLLSSGSIFKPPRC